jgi:hypothetical protein
MIVSQKCMATWYGASLPYCSIEHRDTLPLAAFDAKDIRTGEYRLMCEGCFKQFSAGFANGRKLKLRKEANGQNFV